MLHSLSPARENIHGHFSKDLPPVLTIDPGDTVVFECLDAMWSLEPYNGIDLNRQEVPNRDPLLDSGHCLTGPVAISGAKAGQTLKVQIEEIVVGEWGTTMVGGWTSPWNEKIQVTDEGVFFIWEYDRTNNRATNQFGHSVPMSPFMGVYGMPTNEPGVLSTIPPRRTGGNLDCKELVAGSTLYLPIEVDGGLFSVGDGHAAQGDGEICSTAIECPMERVKLTFDVIDDMPLLCPIADSPNGWITLGLGQTLDEATLMAIESMAALMGRQYGLNRLNAIGLASLCVNFRVTQTVNETQGIHAILPHGVLKV